MLKTDNEAFNQEFDEIKEQFYKVMQKNLSQGNPAKHMSKAKKYVIAIKTDNKKFNHRVQNNFAKSLIKEFAETTNIDFYRKKAFLFEQIWLYYEMLLEAVAMLSLDASREIGIFVINTANMSWQLVQELLKQKKAKFSKLVGENLSPIEMELFNIVNEVFQMHGALRHPITENKGQYNWIFDKVWAEEYVEKVRLIGQTLIQILDCLKFELDPDITFLKATKEEKQQIIDKLQNN